MQQSHPFSARIAGGSFDNTFITDMQTGIWASQGARFQGSGWQTDKLWSGIKFSLEAIAGEGIR